MKLKAFVLASAAAVALSANLVGVAHAKTFKWASASDIPTWDIHSQNNALANGIHAAVYESTRLLQHRKFELEPVLATALDQQVSPTQLRIKLRPGVKFQRRRHVHR
jgi:peptide/nickel transport system substrate-binding protein